MTFMRPQWWGLLLFNCNSHYLIGHKNQTSNKLSRQFCNFQMLDFYWIDTHFKRNKPLRSLTPNLYLMTKRFPFRGKMSLGKGLSFMFLHQLLFTRVLLFNFCLNKWVIITSGIAMRWFLKQGFFSMKLLKWKRQRLTIVINWYNICSIVGLNFD